tara:strand:- start:16287 stop:17417 length:1131 start_codon:yes stop_codon:yes gene_type:complete
MRPKAFFINGGAGRVLSSIPALEKYAETHDDFVIVCEAGTDFYKGHPVLHNKCYDSWHKNLFEEHLIHRDLVSPEPYRCWHYYNQKCNLAQAFDIIINELDEPRELQDPSIHLSKMEVVTAQNILTEIKAGTGKEKVVIIQPFGRGVTSVGDFVVDPGSRSMNMVNTVDIINDLKKDYAVAIMSEIHFPVEENEEKAKHKVARPQIEDIRIWAGVIDGADHFIGCDSVGQHIAKALKKTATVVIGSTFPINISYPDFKDFDIVDVGEGRRKYDPIRITMDEERTRYNDQACEMSDAQVREVITSARKRLGKSVKYTGPSLEQLTQNEGQQCAAPTPVQNNLQFSTMEPTKLKIPSTAVKPNKGFKSEVENLLKSSK